MPRKATNHGKGGLGLEVGTEASPRCLDGVQEADRGQEDPPVSIAAWRIVGNQAAPSVSRPQAPLPSTATFPPTHTCPVSYPLPRGQPTQTINPRPEQL